MSKHSAGPWSFFEGDKKHREACIIAAAPDLLAACEKLAAWDKSHDDAQLISEACSLARAAIAKAEGK